MITPINCASGSECRFCIQQEIVAWAAKMPLSRYIETSENPVRLDNCRSRGTVRRDSFLMEDGNVGSTLTPSSRSDNCHTTLHSETRFSNKTPFLYIVTWPPTIPTHFRMEACPERPPTSRTTALNHQRGSRGRQEIRLSPGYQSLWLRGSVPVRTKPCNAKYEQDGKHTAH